CKLPGFSVTSALSFPKVQLLQSLPVFHIFLSYLFFPQVLSKRTHSISKMDFHSYGLLVISLICLHLNRITLAGHGEPWACMEKLKPDDKKEAMAVMETCKKKLGIDELPKLEELEKNGFDDKCFAKCKLTEMKLISDKGVPDTAALDELLKKIIPEKQADISSLWKTCFESTKKTMDAEGGFEKNSCKGAALLKHCIMEGIQKLC
ncbi:hypothetical protein Ocin01_01268, partial [Orchesella cincta]